MTKRRGSGLIALEAVAVLLALVIFGVPFLFVLFNAGKSVSESSVMHLTPPVSPQYLRIFP